MDPNNFNLLEDEILKKHPEAPGQVEHNINSNIHTFSIFGKVVELFIPRIFDSLINAIGGSSRSGTTDVANNPVAPNVPRGNAKSDDANTRGIE